MDIRTCEAPSIPVPKSLRGSDPGSFAEKTMTQRVPTIARRCLEYVQASFPASAAEKMGQLISEIPSAPLRPIYDPGAPDEADWNRYLESFPGQNWLQVPWFFAENYFYRRIMEATGYFQPGPGYHRDPFENQKLKALDSIRDQLPALGDWMKEQASLQVEADALSQLLKGDLWGNQADLSADPGGSKQNMQVKDPKRQDARLLVDDSAELVDTLLHLPEPKRVDLLADNASVEMIYDLILADALLSRGIARTVVFHLKAHPTFVSDVMIQDIHRAVDYLDAQEIPEIQGLAQRVQEQLGANSLRLVDHLFWNSPLYGWQMPVDVREDLAGASLLISKGDANYRRWLGDAHWPLMTPFNDIVCYTPAPLAILRVLKAEICVGLSPEVIETTSREDPDWLVDGKWGIVQFTGN